MKKIISMAIAVSCTLGAVAQTQKNYAGSSRFTDNWSLGIEGGIQTNLHEWNAPQGGLFGINLNRDITPIWGITAEVGAGVNTLANWNTPVKHVHNWVAIDQLSVLADVRCNFSNAFFGYKGKPRFFEVEGVAGFGYGHGYSADASGVPSGNALLAKTGLNLNFYLDSDRAWAATVKPAVEWNISRAKQFNVNYAVAQLTAGVVYHFKTSNGKHYPQKAVLRDQSEIDALNSEINKLRNENAALNDKLAYASTPQTSEVVKTVPVKSDYLVTFAKNSSKLSESATATLDQVPTNVTVDLVGTASPEGSASYNQKLSEKRAEAVKAYLENRGVKVASCVGKGATQGSDSNRIVVVTVK